MGVILSLLETRRQSQSLHDMVSSSNAMKVRKNCVIDNYMLTNIVNVFLKRVKLKPKILE